jgi:hypothetical protein
MLSIYQCPDNPEPDTGCANIPDWILDADVSVHAIRLYCTLQAIGDQPADWATVAQRMRCTTSKAEEALRELLAIQAIAVEHRDNLPSVYTLAFHPEARP